MNSQTKNIGYWWKKYGSLKGSVYFMLGCNCGAKNGKKCNSINGGNFFFT